MLPWLSKTPRTVHVVMYSPLGHRVTVSHNLQGLPSSHEGPPTTLQNHHELAMVDANRPPGSTVLVLSILGKFLIENKIKVKMLHARTLLALSSFSQFKFDTELFVHFNQY